MKKIETRSVEWVDSENKVQLIDQRKLPTVFEVKRYSKVDEVARAIKEMVVRGAPAIGATGAYGMVLAAHDLPTNPSSTTIVDAMSRAKETLDNARPTAVNLEWATKRMLEFARAITNSSEKCTKFLISNQLLGEAKRIAAQDIEINRRLGRFGAAVVPNGANILHHCNTGSLATVDRGTALGVVYECHDQGKGVHVWVDETRPRLQGARLTAWELMRYGVPLHLIADNAAGLIMLQGRVDIVLYGADRVAANGDICNKIGTYKVSVVARENGIPVYACVPTSTIDLTCETGAEIPIEEREAEEVTSFGVARIAPVGCPVFNPAFDVTPYRYLTGIITEEGICYPPFKKTLRAAKERAEQRVKASQQSKL